MVQAGLPRGGRRLEISTSSSRRWLVIRLKIIVDVDEISPEARGALEKCGRIVNENPADKSYVLEILAERDPERRQASMENICE